MKTETVGCRLAAIVIVMMRPMERKPKANAFHTHCRIHTPSWKGKSGQQIGGGIGLGKGERADEQCEKINNFASTPNWQGDRSVRRCDNQLIINYILFLFDANDNIPTASL